jgi:N-acyl-D-aspartate/D-glutamate deacylase
MHDLVIRGGTIVNGLGHDPIRADIAIKDGRIAAMCERSPAVTAAAYS